MKALLIRLFLVIIPFTSLAGQEFEKYFTSGVLRFDYLLSGRYDTAMVFPCQLKKEKIWGGSLNNLIESTVLGTYQFQVFDEKSGDLIFFKRV